MKIWWQRFEIAIWVLVLVAVFWRVVTLENNSSAKSVSVAQIRSAVERGLIQNFSVAGLQLKAQLTPEGRKEFQATELSLAEEMSFKDYEYFLDKRLASTPFLGPVGPMPVPRSVQEWRKDLLAAPNAEPFLQERLEVSAMGLMAGTISLKHFWERHKTAGDLVKITLSAETSGNFRHIYSVQDSSEVYIQVSTGTPVLEHLTFKETDQAGEVWLLQNKDVQIEKQLYHRRSGKIFQQSVTSSKYPVQFISSLIFALTQELQSPHTIRLFDLNEIHEFQLRSHSPTQWVVEKSGEQLPVEITRSEEKPRRIRFIKVQTALGQIQARSL